jgi:uncharacterized protein (TIGR02757 family)
MRFSDDIKSLLNQKADFYNQPSFISNDPISIPHLFSKKEDIEISGFLTAILSWGRRDMIIKSGKLLMQLMNNEPFYFLLNANKNDFQKLESFYYRTFNCDDLLFLLYALKEIYKNNSGLENIANTAFKKSNSILGVIVKIRETLLQTPHLRRSEKHLSNPLTGSAAKRINMFLRWMVRNDNNGVDFGIWKQIPKSALMCPLDIHSGRTARKLGLLKRKQNDWKAVEELTKYLRVLNPEDPVKYDFALFGMSIFE